jgi:hypothetical protein
VSYSPHGGDATEADGQEIQPPGDAIPFLNATEEPGIKYPQTFQFPNGTGFPRRIPVGGSVFLHDLKLGRKGFLAGNLLTYFHILGSFYIKMRHTSLLLDPAGKTGGF